MPSARVHLHISKVEMARYYAGHAQSVIAMSDTGLRIQFPAINLRAFMTEEGVQGAFIIHYDNQGKLLNIERCTGS